MAYFLQYNGNYLQVNGQYQSVKSILKNDFTSITIGTQTWMQYNLVEGGKTYENDEANRANFGAMYTWSEISNLNISGWRLPTLDDFYTLAAFVGETEGITYGGTLKDTSLKYWRDVTGHTNSSGFSIRGAGYYQESIDTFSDLLNLTAFWTSTNMGDDTIGTPLFYANSDNVFYITAYSININSGDRVSARLIHT